LALDRGDVDDYTGSLLKHQRQKRAIQTDRREKVLVEGLVPFFVVQHREAAGWR
jgi:hypothetical protein